MSKITKKNKNYTKKTNKNTFSKKNPQKNVKLESKTYTYQQKCNIVDNIYNTYGDNCPSFKPIQDYEIYYTTNLTNIYSTDQERDSPVFDMI